MPATSVVLIADQRAGISIAMKIIPVNPGDLPAIYQIAARQGFDLAVAFSRMITPEEATSQVQSGRPIVGLPGVIEVADLRPAKAGKRRPAQRTPGSGRPR